MKDPGVDRTAGEALFDEIAQVFLFQRDAIRNSIGIRRSNRRRENSTEFSKEGGALVATAIWNGDGLQGNMIEPMSYETGG